MGEMSIHGGGGDTRHTWNPDNPDEVTAMRKLFNDTVKSSEGRARRFRAFRVNPDTAEKDDEITEFDPDAGKVIIVAPIGGGC